MTPLSRIIPPCTDGEIMALGAARLIRDGDIVFTGTGIALLAGAAAKKLFGKKVNVFFETGGIDPALDEIPMAVADSRVMSKTAMNTGLIDAFSILGHRKLRTIALLGAAQVDRFGNLNTTSIGDYRRPQVRFSGSGGACDAAALAASVIVFMKHEKRRFVDRLDYLTSVGWYRGGQSRQALGLKRGGPLAVVTHLGTLKFDDHTKEMFLAEYNPGVSPERIRDETGFALDISRAREAVCPTEDELRILRQEVDPQGLMR